MPDIVILLLSGLAVLGGLVLLGYAVVLRLGGTPDHREWAAGSEESARSVILMMPGGGALLAAVGCTGLAGTLDVLVPFVALFAILGVPPVLWAGLRIPMPLWFFPRWARDQRARVRARKRSPTSPRKRR